MYKGIFNNRTAIIISLLFSTFSIVILFIINKQLSTRYIEADGKTRALFGITELTFISYKIYSVILSILSLTILFLGSKKDNGGLFWTAFNIAVISLIMLFIRFWKFFL